MSNFSGLTTFEFINLDKVTFFSARISLNFSHFPCQIKHLHLSLISHYRDPKNIFYCQCDIQNYTDQVLNFLPYDRHAFIYTRDLPVCNSGQYIYAMGLHHCFFVLQDLIERINSHFQRTAFLRNLLIIDF